MLCRDVQAEACKLLREVLDRALRHTDDLTPLTHMLEPVMSTMVQCFSLEAAACSVAPVGQQPAGSQPSLEALAGLIDLLILQVRCS